LSFNPKDETKINESSTQLLVSIIPVVLIAILFASVLTVVFHKYQVFLACENGRSSNDFIFHFLEKQKRISRNN